MCAIRCAQLWNCLTAVLHNVNECLMIEVPLNRLRYNTDVPGYSSLGKPIWLWLFVLFRKKFHCPVLSQMHSILIYTIQDACSNLILSGAAQLTSLPFVDTLHCLPKRVHHVVLLFLAHATAFKTTFHLLKSIIKAFILHTALIMWIVPRTSEWAFLTVAQSIIAAVIGDAWGFWDVYLS